MAEEDKKAAPAAAPAAAATAAPAPAAAAKKGAEKASTGSLILGIVFLTLVAAVFIFFGMGYVASILIIGALPGISAYVVDHRPGKYASKTVIAFNLSGLLPQLASMFYSSDPNSVAMALFNEPMTWFWIYMFAAFGWLVIHLVPQISFLIFSIRAEYEAKKIRTFQEMLIKEWGDEVTK